MPQSTALEPMVQANDKLLKALVTLLALKDEHLLSELQTVFVIAGRLGNEIGEANEEAWRHLRHELKVIAALVQSEDDDSISDGDPLGAQVAN